MILRLRACVLMVGACVFSCVGGSNGFWLVFQLFLSLFPSLSPCVGEFISVCGLGFPLGFSLGFPFKVGGKRLRSPVTLWDFSDVVQQGQLYDSQNVFHHPWWLEDEEMPQDGLCLSWPWLRYRQYHTTGWQTSLPREKKTMLRRGLYRQCEDIPNWKRYLADPCGNTGKSMCSYPGWGREEEQRQREGKVQHYCHTTSLQPLSEDRQTTHEGESGWSFF